MNYLPLWNLYFNFKNTRFIWCILHSHNTYEKGKKQHVIMPTIKALQFIKNIKIIIYFNMSYVKF